MPLATITPSEFLIDRSQAAAEQNGCTLPTQIEHWAWIGKAAERHLSPATVMALIRCDGNLSVLEDSDERERIEGELAKLRELFGN